MAAISKMAPTVVHPILVLVASTFCMSQEQNKIGLSDPCTKIMSILKPIHKGIRRRYICLNYDVVVDDVGSSVKKTTRMEADIQTLYL